MARHRDFQTGRSLGEHILLPVAEGKLSVDLFDDVSVLHFIFKFGGLRLVESRLDFFKLAG